VPTYATQAGELRPLNLLTGGVPAQTQETVLHSFGTGSDGSSPFAGLTNVNGVLYGTTYTGGANGPGAGTVFEITTSGAESVLYNFQVGTDGQGPFAGLTNVNGVLYGTTVYGGTYGYGTVYEITTSGSESVLYSFTGESDGSEPYGGLTNLNGVLYGTTSGGGANGDGTVFKITMSGAESVLHSFAAGSDGKYPKGNLTAFNGVLYGTTVVGGPNNDGTVFKITTAGAESVLLSFAGGSGGSGPSAGLTNVGGVLYGTTEFGGTLSHNVSGYGTVFKITTSGTEEILHKFGGGNDGRNPSGPLTNVSGVLYGTTNFAGSIANSVCCGTAFKITTFGVKSTVYRFAGGSDGESPTGALTDVNGVLYGTTLFGGANGVGTVYSLSL